MNIPILIVVSLAVIIAGFAFCRRDTQVPKKHSFQQDSTVLIKNGDSLIYELLIPKVDSFGEFPMTTVKLKKANDKPTLIEFQPGGTETNILLFDTTSSSRLPGNSVVKKLFVFAPKLKNETIWNILATNAYLGKKYLFSCRNYRGSYYLVDWKEVENE